MRIPSVLALLLAALLLPGCGGKDEVAGARVRILIGPADEALEGTLRLQHLDADARPVFDARPLGDGVYVAPGAPEGRYRVFTTAGWGMLWNGRSDSIAPVLRGASLPATVVRMGKARTLYVASGLPGRWTLGERWAAEWKRIADGDAAPFQRAAIAVADVGEGILALRFQPDVWAAGHLIRVVGLMSDGTVAAMESYQVPDSAYAHLPRLALVLGAAQAALTVHLVPPPGVEQVADGTPVRVRLRDVPLEHAYEAESFGGRAVFDQVAALGHGLRVELPQSGSAFDLPPETWRARGAVHAVSGDRAGLVAVDVREVAGAYVEAMVCYRGGTAFGRVPIERLPAPADASEHTARLQTHPGWQEWWLKTADGAWVYTAVDVPTSPEETLRVDPGRAEGRGVHVRGRVNGPRTGRRVVFLQVRAALALEDGEAVFAERRLAGDGFEATVTLPDGGYEADLPPGRYEVRVVGPGGGGAPPMTLPFKPGAEVHLDLDAR